MTKSASLIDAELELRIDRVAHGGVFVARHEGKVVFVSHAAPGEVVRAKVFEDRGGSFCRAETIEVLEPSPHRVKHIWKEAVTQAAGGAEFGHLDLSYQRELKSQVLAEAISRMAKLDLTPEVAPVSGDIESNGLGYRTRVQLQVSAEGVAGPYRERSHEVVSVKTLPLAVSEINELGLHLKNWQVVKKIQIAASATGGLQWMIDKKVKGDGKLIERALGRSFRLSPGGFWQVHKGAAELLATEVVTKLAEAGFTEASDNHDLYGGVGLFSGALASKFGKNLRITSVESNKTASQDAAANLIDIKGFSAVAAPVAGYLKKLVAMGRKVPDATFVLDPPRSGAGSEVIENLAKLGPRTIAYVACDPVALARDLGQMLNLGYQVQSISAFDLFPHTHHFESLAILVAA